MNLVVISGANGFVGRHLVKSLSDNGQRVRALTRTPRAVVSGDSSVEWVIGDVAAQNTWERLVEPGCVVVNLAYSLEAATAGAKSATRNMAAACATAGVSRMVHCSTISVYGRTTDKIITETSSCNAVDSYGRLKLIAEKTLLDSIGGRFEVAVLRPSAVFGYGGQALLSLCDNLIDGSRAINYLRSSLFGRRNMHLVPVETVVAAIRFLCETRQQIENEIFIVSDDDAPHNNFRDVERILMEELRIPPYAMPLIPFSRQWVEGLIRLKGRSEIDTRTEYRCDKLLRWGFSKPIEFEAALRAYAGACHLAHHSSP